MLFVHRSRRHSACLASPVSIWSCSKQTLMIDQSTTCTRVPVFVSSQPKPLFWLNLFWLNQKVAVQRKWQKCDNRPTIRFASKQIYRANSKNKHPLPIYWYSCASEQCSLQLESQNEFPSGKKRKRLSKRFRSIKIVRANVLRLVCDRFGLISLELVCRRKRRIDHANIFVWLRSK